MLTMWSILKITPVFKLSHLLETFFIDDVIYDLRIQINFLSFFNRFLFLFLRSIIKPHVPLFLQHPIKTIVHVFCIVFFFFFFLEVNSFFSYLVLFSVIKMKLRSNFLFFIVEEEKIVFKTIKAICDDRWFFSIKNIRKVFRIFVYVLLGNDSYNF